MRVVVSRGTTVDLLRHVSRTISCRVRFFFFFYFRKQYNIIITLVYAAGVFGRQPNVHGRIAERRTTLLENTWLESFRVHFVVAIFLSSVRSLDRFKYNIIIDHGPSPLGIFIRYYIILLLYIQGQWRRLPMTGFATKEGGIRVFGFIFAASVCPGWGWEIAEYVFIGLLRRGRCVVVDKSDGGSILCVGSRPADRKKNT